MTASSSRPELDERLAGWMAQGLIDAGQAERIGAAEATRQVMPAATPRRLPLVVEALGYLGAVLAVMAALIAARQLLPAISVGAELAFAAAGAGVLLLAGILLPVKDRGGQRQGGQRQGGPGRGGSGPGGSRAPAQRSLAGVGS